MRLPLSIINRNPANSCEIFVEVLQEGQEDTFPTLRIGQVTGEIVNECLVRRRMVGMNVSYLFGQEIFENVLLLIVSLHSFSTSGKAALTLGLLDRSTEEDD